MIAKASGGVLTFPFRLRFIHASSFSSVIFPALGVGSSVGPAILSAKFRPYRIPFLLIRTLPSFGLLPPFASVVRGVGSNSAIILICCCNPTCANRPVYLSYARFPIRAGSPVFVTRRPTLTFGSCLAGVCNNPYSVPAVRGVDGASWNNKRLDFIVRIFQRSTHVFECQVDDNYFYFGKLGTETGKLGIDGTFPAFPNGEIGGRSVYFRFSAVDWVCNE